MCQFGIPQEINIDNETQFEYWKVKNLCQEQHIKDHFSMPAYLKGNGQAKVSNKTILAIFKKMLETLKFK